MKIDFLIVRLIIILFKKFLYSLMIYLKIKVFFLNKKIYKFDFM